RPARGRQGGDGREVEGRLRRADPRRGVALRHVPVHPGRRERRRPRPRGDRLQDRRGAALLSDEPRPDRGGGERDDRLRVRRADHEGAAARVRRRDEPADPAADGGLSRLIDAGRVDFIAVPTKDRGRAAKFYEETLGLKRNPNSTDTWVEFETDNVTLAIV